MPWTETRYPDSLKNFDLKTRNKAIEISNALLKEGYSEGAAIAIGTVQAKKWVEGSMNEAPNDDYHVFPHPQGWAVRRDGASRASSVFPTKVEAKDKAIDYARNEGVQVVVYDRDGRVQTYVDLVDEVSHHQTES
ncbi:MAG: DUF2188 domain-containing protein [Anaerolineae bacterium]|nr:DUF2188 domain-containing protein [Anaerolineae bacterium]